MLDQVFRNPAVLARIRANPIEPIICQYVAYLADRRYCTYVLHRYTLAVEHFGHWLGRRPIDRRTVDRFIKRRVHRQRTTPACRKIACVRAALNRLLEMLGRDKAGNGSGILEQLIARYAGHLRQDCGLSEATIHYRLRYARELLRRLRIRRTRQLLSWSPSQIARCTSTLAGRCKPSSGQALASSIRSFLRFLLMEGLIRQDLAAAVPSFASWRLTVLPTVADQTDLEKLIKAVDDTTPIGMRDRAALLCLTELGLRASDVAAIELEAVDITAGILRFRRPKQRCQTEMPLTPRLTSAIDLYMRRGRPAGSSRWLFVIHRAPIGQRLTAGGIGRIVTRRVAQAGLADRIHGPHVIRHSVATALINQGASIKQIADLLGHRSIDTTSIYAKVDLRSLVEVALPWPHLSPREVRP